jgi:hypothetical protein
VKNECLGALHISSALWVVKAPAYCLLLCKRSVEREWEVNKIRPQAPVLDFGFLGHPERTSGNTDAGDGSDADAR